MRNLFILAGMFALLTSFAHAQNAYDGISNLESALYYSNVTCETSNGAFVNFSYNSAQEKVQVDNQNIYLGLQEGVSVAQIQPLSVINTFRGSSLNSLYYGYEVGDREKVLTVQLSADRYSIIGFDVFEKLVTAVRYDRSAVWSRRAIFHYSCQIQ